MDFLNLKFQYFSSRLEKLSTIERKQAATIRSLKRECENLDLTRNPNSSPTQKFWAMKQLQKTYTFQFPKARKVLQKTTKKSLSFDTLNHGCKRKSELRNFSKLKEISERHSKMILAGNSFSLNNLRQHKSSQMSRKSSKSINLDKIKHKMIVKSRQLGNHYTQVFINKQKPSSKSNKLDNLDRYHRLMDKKKEFKKAHRRYKTNRGESPKLSVVKRSKIFDEFCRLEKSLRIKNRLHPGKSNLLFILKAL